MGLSPPPLPLLTRVEQTLRRLSRRERAIRGDLTRIDEIVSASARGPWLIQLAARAPRGARALEGTDWSSGEEVPFTFALDPKRPARAQVERLFVDARRMLNGKQRVEERLVQTLDDLREATDILHALSEPDSDEAALSERFEARFGGETRRLAVRGLERNKKPPFRTFRCSGNLFALVGRDARRNDETTTKFAKPWHLWLHARGVPGSHVIGAIDKGGEVTPDFLIDCAHLAAHFSSVGTESVAEITYTERRFVRKPRKSAPGAVVVDREKVLPLRVDRARIESLLRGEVFEDLA